MSEVAEKVVEPEIVVAKFSQADFPRYSEFLVIRMQRAFDKKGTRITNRSFPGLVSSYMNSNEHHFVRTKMAVGLCELRREALEDRMRARVVFLWAGTKTPEEAEKDMLRLARNMEHWAREAGAVSLDFSPHCDLKMGQMKNTLNALDAMYFYRDLTKPMGPRAIVS